MKKKLLTVALFAIAYTTTFAQLKINQYGRIGIGIEPHPTYKLLVKGDFALTTYPIIPSPLTRYTELRFKVGNGWPGAEIGTPTRNIAFWSSEVGYNTLYAAHFYTQSDSSLKTNITPIQNGLSTVLQLKPYSYHLKDSTGQAIQTKEYGFIAQDIEEILPDITDTAKGIRLLDYEQIIPILAEAIKEQQDTINNLKNIISSYESRFTSIENMLSQCCTQTKSAQTDVNATIVIPTDATMSKTTELYQNRPNPFNVTTTFAYTLGEDGNVELIIEDSYGRLITTLVNQKQIAGDYSIDWNAENISSGIYFYSLKVNGIILVKKAIKY